MTLPFGGEGVPAAHAATVVLPVPYEATTTYRQGTSHGPEALLAASQQVELFDEETRRTPLAAGVATLDPETVDGMPDALAAHLEPIVAEHLAAGRRVVTLGGEHSVSLGPIRAAAARHEGLGVLQIDAHPDLRDEYEGTRFGHGCVMRRVLDDERVARLAQVGLRAVSPEDDEIILQDPRVEPFYAFALAGRPATEWIDEVMFALPPDVYVSIDLDGFDPSVIPGTGTPEPGGLGWWEGLALLRRVCEERNVVAFDVVELLPEPPSTLSDFAAAHLVFKVLAYLDQVR